jgi:hypothetical protein
MKKAGAWERLLSVSRKKRGFLKAVQSMCCVALGTGAEVVEAR